MLNISCSAPQNQSQRSKHVRIYACTRDFVTVSASYESITLEQLIMSPYQTWMYTVVPLVCKMVHMGHLDQPFTDSDLSARVLMSSSFYFST